MREVSEATRDGDLAERIRSGVPDAEEELVRRFEPGLLAIARVRVGRDHAPDLVQETLAAALTNLRRGDWRGEGPLGAYLAAILRRAMHAARAPAAPTAAPDVLERIAAVGADPLSAAERLEERRWLRECLLRLHPRHADVLVRHYFSDQSVEDIARDLGIPHGTVLSRLFHARRELARRLNRGRRRGHTPHGCGR